jgi:signal transduction histidine kinase
LFSLKTKQVAGVTLMVGFAVVLTSAWYISSLVTLSVVETRERAKLIADAVTHRAFDVVQQAADPAAGLAADAGLRDLLQASIFSPDVLYAEIVDRSDTVIAHSVSDNVGRPATAADDLDGLIASSPLMQVNTIYTSGPKSFEYRTPLLINNTEFGSVRVGVSTILLKQGLNDQLATPIATAAIAIGLALLVAMVLAQIALHPIHVIRSGLARLGRGELDVNVNLPVDADLADLGESFKAVSARLAADRSALAGQRAALESVVDSVEDAVALFGPDGAMLFTNQAMRVTFDGREGSITDLLPDGHPYRTAVTGVLATHASQPPATLTIPGVGVRLVLAHAVEDAEHRPLGVLLVVRNLAYLNQVESTLNYSRKLAALGRLSAGIAHEVKNPLNATMIHLELLKMQLTNAPAAMEHVSVIAAQMRRLDEVVQGFLKFTRPEDVKLQPVDLEGVIQELMPIISAEASKSGVEVRLEFPPTLPPASADANMLQQTFLNLALNACQAMPHGGRLRVAAAPSANGSITMEFEDTGIGIAPEHLARIFDLYFTTKEHGSGIGLSLVYRTIQLHGGEIEVQSMPGRGTTFRLVLRQVIGRGARTPIGTLGLRDAEVPAASTAGSTS